MTNRPNSIRIALSCIDHRGQLLEAHAEMQYPSTDVSADRLRYELHQIIAEPFARLDAGVLNGVVPWKRS